MIAELPLSREVRLAKRPVGLPSADHFSIVETPVRQPTDGDVLVRNRWFRVSISTRTMISEGAQNIKGIPFPPVALGDCLADAAIGEVIWAPPASGVKPGDRVSHPFGWREYATVPVRACVPLPAGPIDPVVYLGHGWTAYAALTRGVTLRHGETVFISSGAGAIGSMAGQIAVKLGASRVIGSTGSSEKATWMKNELGYDAVLVRGDVPFATQLAEAAPDGIDVYVDIVGGEQLRAAAANARHGARFVLLGALTAELAEQGTRRVAPVLLDSLQLIMQGVTMRGYSADDDSDAFGEWLQCLAIWQREGGMQLPRSTFSGIENAPKALHDACAGTLKGLVIVELE
ncbi:MDR family NADP-dependent oxidoreductase [Burkholderia cepacia]|uniref:MDR family NADP-dependent oxidoreductase n=1 Tax=Burkholderia cepacia TaxID=292 RepID=UPI00158A1767|nr:NADP-dependent oxidoreductase [Burkholderia cepacia]